MNNQRKLSYVEILFFIISIAFIFACGPLPITKTYTVLSPDISAKSLDAGQVSFGGSYTTGKNSYMVGRDLAYSKPATKDFEYYNANAKVGIVSGLDFGIDYSYASETKDDLADLYSDGYNYGYNYNSSSTLSDDCQSLWLGLKYQFTNRNMKTGKPVIALGLTKGFGFGYTLNNNSVSVTSIPFCLGIPINSSDLIQFTNKFEFVDYSSDSYTRIVLGLGADIALLKEPKDVFMLKIKPRLGYINDFAENNNSSSWYFNIGISFDFKPQ